MATDSNINWAMQADYLSACSCDYGCPCEFPAPPTRGYCEGLGVYRISSGNYGDVSLDGLGLAWALHSPKAIYEGNVTLALFIDAQATTEQREGLVQIVTGKAGGIPFEILASLATTLIDPIDATIDFNINGRNSSVKIGDVAAIELEPIKNPVTGEPVAVRIEHESGLIFPGAEVVSAKIGNVSVEGIEFSWPNKAGFFTQVSYSN